ncbi:hypothetical protein DSL72_007239 [Monilinia vaccinii-corymbosi]|uniref:Prion-inhibition and propagation HeLo domain-containing protein n=1 Tax=Monilinia vaccinii-corymbosi TaxID=61207 RepID=A0A8A3PMF8_9HELO|nr:hypothetical protein DSL72_007239 [Monilinia vaccinii-corymbosi]
MDPISAVGIALSVASLAGQVFTGCIQGIQLIITAKNVPKESRYYNLRLRMEQQRLFAWSETSGLLDLDNQNDQRIRESNTFVIHRTTILDLLVQIQCLFKEFEDAQRKNKHLKVVSDFVSDEDSIDDPARDASIAHVPLSESRRKFIVKAIKSLKKNATEHITEGARRLWWTTFDKDAFEILLQKFSTLNDNMTDILDTRLQTEIHRATQDTNRGVLQLHKDLSSLSQLVMALNIKMDARTYLTPSIPPEYAEDDSSGLKLLSQLAKFKAFNESINSTAESSTWDEAIGEALSLARPNDERGCLQIAKSSIKFVPGDSTTDENTIRCEATYSHDGIEEPVWIEWKEYDYSPGATSPPPLIVDRVQKLAALLHHEPKPEAFRVPHCLGYFYNLAPELMSPLSTDSDPEEDEGPETRYRKSFDIYSFGVVLAELCFWKPIIDIMAEIGKKSPIERSSKRAKDVREILMNEDMLSVIGGEMGEVVEEVVKRCIVGGKELGIEDGEDEMGDERVASKLGMRFFESVVKKLGDVKV